MGRGKIEIKRIENTSNRQVTYSKRKNGIIKKAKEITILCDAKVSCVIYNTSGKIHEYCSPSTNLADMLDKYQTLSGKKLWDPKHENLSNEIERVRKENENMQIELRHLKGEDITSLNHKELQEFEDALENGLTNIRAKKSEIPKMMSKHGQMLEEENRHLQYIMQQSEMAAMEGNMAEMEMNGYHQQRMRDHYNDTQANDHQLPFSFRIQPIQPNLHERI